MQVHGEPAALLDDGIARILGRHFGPRELVDIRHDPYLQALVQDRRSCAIGGSQLVPARSPRDGLRATRTPVRLVPRSLGMLLAAEYSNRSAETLEEFTEHDPPRLRDQWRHRVADLSVAGALDLAAMPTCGVFPVELEPVRK